MYILSNILTCVVTCNLRSYIAKHVTKFCYRQRLSASDATSGVKKLELFKYLNTWNYK